MKKLFTAALAVLTFSIVSCKKENTGEEQLPLPPSLLRLDYVEVEETVIGPYLYLHGSFPDSSSTGTVLFNGEKPFLIDSWSHDLIRCQMFEKNGVKGGKVFVVSNAQTSNSRTLTEWKGQLIFKYPNGGSLLEKIDFFVHLRADIESHLPLAVPLMKPITSFCSDATAHYTINGQGQSQFTDPGAACNPTTMTVNFSNGAGIFEWRSPKLSVIGADNFYNAKLEFVEGLGFRIKDINVWKLKAATKTTNTTLPAPCNVSSTSQLDYNLTDIPDLMFRTLDNKYNVVMELKGSSIMPGGKTIYLKNRAELIYNAPVPDVPVSLEWNEMIKQ